jgi:hypothetical protein
MPLAHDLVSGVLPAAHSRVACFSLSALLRTRKLPSQRFPPLALPQGPLHPVLDDVQQTVAFHNNIFPYLSFAWGTVIMSKGVKEVVQIVAPIALKALVTAAEALIAGAAYADKRSLHNLLAASGDDASIIENDTTTYVNTNFATTFGYYYEGLRSRPTTGALPITASQDILIWDAGGKTFKIFRITCKLSGKTRYLHQMPSLLPRTWVNCSRIGSRKNRLTGRHLTNSSKRSSMTGL